MDGTLDFKAWKKQMELLVLQESEPSVINCPGDTFWDGEEPEAVGKS